MDQELKGITDSLIERAKKVLDNNKIENKAYFIMRYPNKPKLVFYNIPMGLVFTPMGLRALPWHIKKEWSDLMPTRPEGTQLIAVIVMTYCQISPKDVNNPNKGRQAILATVCTPARNWSYQTFYTALPNGKVKYEPTTEYIAKDYGILTNLYPIYDAPPDVTDKAPIVAVSQYLKERAQKLLRKEGSLKPKLYFLILYPGQKTPVYFPIPCEMVFMGGNKEMLPDYAQMCWYKKKSESPAGIQLLAVCLVTDSWVSSSPKPDGMSTEEFRKQPRQFTPAEDPNREEAILLTINYPNKATVISIRYKRKGGNIEFGKEFSYDENVLGRITSLYPKAL